MAPWPRSGVGFKQAAGFLKVTINIWSLKVTKNILYGVPFCEFAIEGPGLRFCVFVVGWRL